MAKCGGNVLDVKKQNAKSYMAQWVPVQVTSGRRNQEPMNIPPMLEAGRDRGLPGVGGKSETSKGSFLALGGRGFTPKSLRNRERDREAECLVSHVF